MCTDNKSIPCQVFDTSTTVQQEGESLAEMAGRRQRELPSLKQQRVRLCGQCWMSPGHPCLVPSVSSLRNTAKVAFLLLLVTFEALLSCPELDIESVNGLPTLHAAVGGKTAKYIMCLVCML